MIHRRPLVVLTIVITTLSAVTVRAQGRPFTVHDLVAMQRVADPQPSPDGSEVAFVVTTMDLEANRGRKDVWLAAVDGSGARPITSHPDNDWEPRWAGDGSLYFLSDRTGSAQVWRISPSGGDPRQVTELPLDAQVLQVGPEGSTLYVAMAVFPDCGESLACTVDRLDERSQRRTSGLIFDRLFVRHWDSWKDGRRNHLFRISIDQHGIPTAAPVDLMAGVDGDCPTLPFGDGGDFTISPDGAWLVYTAKVVPGSEEAWSTDLDLWAVPTDGSEPARCLTEPNLAEDRSPAFSPDGSRLAYLAMSRPGYEADRRRLMLMDWPAGSPTVLTERWDRSPGEIVWSADGAALYVVADNIGNHSIFRVDAASGAVAALVTRHFNSNPRPLIDGSLVFSQDSLVTPAELFTLDEAGSIPRQVTRLNEARLAELEFGEYRQFSFLGANNEEVFGYLIYPVDFDPGATYPLAFLVHGGPQGTFDDHWHYRWNPQVYAGHGYATVMIDFHGSTGYGQAFTDAIRDDWGGGSLRGPDEGARRRAATPQVDRRRPHGRSRRLLRRVHDQLDPGQHRPVPGAGLSRRQPRRADGLLRHRGALVPGVGASRHTVGQPRRVSQALADQPRPALVNAAAGDPRRQRLPCSGHPGHRHLQRAAATGRAVSAALFPRREPLGPQAAQLDPMARGRARLDG